MIVQAEATHRDKAGPHAAEHRLGFDELHTRYLDHVYRYVAGMLRTQEDSEDVTAETFAAAYLALPKFDRRCPHLLWLYRIARGKVVDHVRRHRARQRAGHDIPFDRLAVPSPGETPEQAAFRADRDQRLRSLIDGLPADHREVLLLKYVEQLSLQEIGVVLKRSPKAVNSLLQRARTAVARTGRSIIDESEESQHG